MEAQSLAYKYQCQSAILEIMTHDMFLKKKLLHAESFLKEASESKERSENGVSTGKSKSANNCDLKDIFSSWSEGSNLANLIKSYASCEYDNEIHYRAKVSFQISFIFSMLRCILLLFSFEFGVSF